MISFYYVRQFLFLWPTVLLDRGDLHFDHLFIYLFRITLLLIDTIDRYWLLIGGLQ